MVLYVDGVNVDEEIIKCHEEIEYWTSRLETLQQRKNEEKCLDNLCKTLNRCGKCVYETSCNMSDIDTDGNCKKYKREEKDGDFYG